MGHKIQNRITNKTLLLILSRRCRCCQQIYIYIYLNGYLETTSIRKSLTHHFVPIPVLMSRAFAPSAEGQGFDLLLPISIHI